MKIDTTDPHTLSVPQDIPKKYFRFNKNNKQNEKYVGIEVWADGHPGKAERKLVEVDMETFRIDKTRLDSMIAYWVDVARGAGFESPILTIQGDLGNGAELLYGYSDNREGIPPNARTYSIKPVFDKSIMKMRHGGKQ